MARERLCWAPWTGPTKRTTPQSCDESLRRLGLRCPLMRRHHNARRCFELTGQVTPIHIPGLADLVGRVPGAPPEYRRAPSPRRPCRGPGATCHPWRQGWRHGWRALFIRRDTVGGSGRHQGLRGRAGIGKHPRVGAAVVAKPKDARAGVIECEHIWDADPLEHWWCGGRPPVRRRVLTCAAACAHPHWERTG